jgi:hypothetical protein
MLRTLNRSDVAGFSSNTGNYFGIGMDTALPAPRSGIRMVSPAGSTAVGGEKKFAAGLAPTPAVDTQRTPLFCRSGSLQLLN